MGITVNNKHYEYIEQETVKDLLRRIKFTFPLVIVKINEKHIPRDAYHKTIIPEDADIKVIHMISGG